MINILVEKGSTTYINEVCFEHQKPLLFCNDCQISIINKFNICKDMKNYISNFLANITKFPFIFHEEEDENMEGCYRTHISFVEKKEKLKDGMFYFKDCSEEFIFGFLSYLSFIYTSCNMNYLLRYENRYQDELDYKYQLLDEYKNMNVMTSYDNAGYFHVYLTTNPEEFKKGWRVSQKMELSVCKYNQMEDETIYQDKIKFQEIKDYI